MKLIVSAIAIAALTGCSSFKMGTVLYLPHGQSAELQVRPPAPAPAASAPAKPQ